MVNQKEKNDYELSTYPLRYWVMSENGLNLLDNFLLELEKKYGPCVVSLSPKGIVKIRNFPTVRFSHKKFFYDYFDDGEDFVYDFLRLNEEEKKFLKQFFKLSKKSELKEIEDIAPQKVFFKFEKNPETVTGV